MIARNIEAGPMADPAFADALIERALTFALQRYGVHPEQPGACVFLTLSALAAAETLGLPLLLQAGSAGWLRVPLERQDEEHAEFAYEWSPRDPISQMQIAMGALPEIHCWVAEPISKQLLDLSLLGLPATCTLHTGLTWDAVRPGRVDCWLVAETAYEKRWRYQPHRDAIEYMLIKLRGDGFIAWDRSAPHGIRVLR